MSSFPDEARSRVQRLLRMARTEDRDVHARITAYADRTPEPPPMGAHGLATRGCPACRSTMWEQRDQAGPVWVCAGCGRVEEPGTVECPHCETRMRPRNVFGRFYCSTCPRYALDGDTAEDIEAHEEQRLEAIRLLDGAIAEEQTLSELEESWGRG